MKVEFFVDKDAVEAYLKSKKTPLTIEEYLSSEIESFYVDQESRKASVETRKSKAKEIRDRMKKNKK